MPMSICQGQRILTLLPQGHTKYGLISARQVYIKEKESFLGSQHIPF